MYQDCGNYTPAEGGGANGCIQYEAEFVPGISSRGDGLRAALARLQELHREVAEHVSLADFHVVPVIHYASQIPEGQALLNNAPALASWMERMNARESVSATIPSMG